MYSNNRNSGYYSGEGGPATSCHMFNPYHVYPDIFGNVYIASISYGAIYVVNSEGIISTFAGGNGRGSTGDGGPASSAQLNGNNGLHADIYGNVFIADFSMRIRMVNNAGIISTIAGTHLIYHLLYHHLLTIHVVTLISLSLYSPSILSFSQAQGQPALVVMGGPQPLQHSIYQQVFS
jgi:hypothetical protein